MSGISSKPDLSIIVLLGSFRIGKRCPISCFTDLLSTNTVENLVQDAVLLRRYVQPVRESELPLVSKVMQRALCVTF